MRLLRLDVPSAIGLVLMAASISAQTPQPNDAGYTQKIRAFTTDRQFLTELVDHLPASSKVPTPEKILGYISGDPGQLTYAKDVFRFMRELEKASPRVKVFSMGMTEEGREMIVVVVSDEKNIERLPRLRQITAKLADPRRIAPAEAKELIAEGLPIYWAAGAIHSPETGSPEMLMELAYRLAVEESEFIQTIRKNAVVMLTPVIEVDGREKMVDRQRYRKANPNKVTPALIYWGKYVAHDNNRDGMALSLALSRNITRTFLDYHPQVLHDLHESVPFLYTSTGMGPYNAWLDPIVINEWQKLAYHEIEQMTKRGVPGVWTHGFYDGWAANYMIYAAQGHNSIGRFYETFGNSWPETTDRSLQGGQTSRAWFRPNPPFPRVKWSLRNNVNMQQSALLLAMNYTARNGREFLENFYLKSRRSVEKATKEGPAAWVIPADDPRPAEAANLVNLLRLQGVEVHRLDREVEASSQKFPPGSYVIRMDQPYSRMADVLLDTQFYNVSDPRPYDDTGWTFGPLRNVKTVRVTAASILRAPMRMINSPAWASGGIEGTGAAGFVIKHNADTVLASLRYRLKDVSMLAAEAEFTAGKEIFPAGSLLIAASQRARLQTAASELGVRVHALDAMPKVSTHEIEAPRIALVHSWLSTQNEGWFRLAFENAGVPYSYISDHVLRNTPNLKERFDVIVFGPTPGAAQRVVNGLPMTGEPIPYKKSDLTPNFGTSPDQADDIRGGMGLEGLVNVRKFVEQGGLFVLIAGNAAIPIDYGLIDGVSIQQTRDLQVRGSVLNAVFADKKSPIAYGYGDRLAVYFSQAPVFQVSAPGGFGGGAGGPGADAGSRPSGRGTSTDPDIPQGRAYQAPVPRSPIAPGEVPEEFREALRPYLGLPRPRIILRFADERDLLVSGMLAGGRELAGKPAVISIANGKGHYLLFANNPMWRMQTQGSHFLLFNAVLHYKHLGSGVTPARIGSPSGAE